MLFYTFTLCKIGRACNRAAAEGQGGSGRSPGVIFFAIYVIAAYAIIYWARAVFNQ